MPPLHESRVTQYWMAGGVIRENQTMTVVIVLNIRHSHTCSVQNQVRHSKA